MIRFDKEEIVHWTGDTYIRFAVGTGNRVSMICLSVPIDQEIDDVIDTKVMSKVLRQLADHIEKDESVGNN